MIKRTLLAAMAVTVAGAVGADAQTYPDYRFDIGINGGFAGYTSMLDDEHLNQGDDVRFEAGWLLGFQATGWVTPRFGLRGNMTYTERPLNEGGFFDMGDEDNLVEDINLWNVTGDLMIRLIPDGYYMGGVASSPFLALGAGAKYVDMAVQQDLTADLRGQGFITSDGQRWALIEEWQLMGLAALGTDLRFSDNFALRLEFGDRFYDSPIRSEANLTANPDEDTGNVVHELYGQIGAHFLLGLAAPEVVAVAPAPPPPAPAPEPEPEPEPEPVEERMMICVVDTDAPGGLRMVDAIYLPETRDTVVEEMGTRRDFQTAVPSVMVANEADWFVRGEPLTISIAPDVTMEYTTWQSARTIEADQLVYLGTSRGLPVYANASDVADIRTQWESAQNATMTDDLDTLLSQNAELAAALEEVQYLYVPLRPVGCVFQAVRMVEQVRKK